MSKEEFFRKSYLDIYNHGKDLRMYVSDGKKWYIDKVPEFKSVEAGIIKWNGKIFSWTDGTKRAASWGFFDARRQLDLDPAEAPNVHVERYMHTVWRQLAEIINRFLTTRWISSAVWYAADMRTILPVPLAFAEANRHRWDKTNKLPELLRAAYDIAVSLDPAPVTEYARRDLNDLQLCLALLPDISERGYLPDHFSDERREHMPPLLRKCCNIYERERTIKMALNNERE